MKKINIWGLSQKHKYYGRVIMMRTIEGEPYRFFMDKYKNISMIPLSALPTKEGICECKGNIKFTCLCGICQVCRKSIRRLKK